MPCSGMPPESGGLVDWTNEYFPTYDPRHDGYASENSDWIGIVRLRADGDPGLSRVGFHRLHESDDAWVGV
jgi:hypothetical protein